MTVVSSVAVLFEMSGSVDVEFTVAVSTIENPPGEGAFHTRVKSGAEEPEARLFPRVHVMVPPTGAGHTQPDPMTLKKLPLIGIARTTLTPVALCGPAFATWIV